MFYRLTYRHDGEKGISMKTRLKLTDKQFDALDPDTRRAMIYQLMFIDTPKYQYCIGACGQWWTMVRYEWLHAGEVDRETSTVVDKWL